VARTLRGMRHVKPDSSVAIVGIVQRHATTRPDFIAILCRETGLETGTLNRYPKSSRV